MTEKKFWNRLQEYRCPLMGCGALLKEFRQETKDQSEEVKITHQCTACNFMIKDKTLTGIAKVPGRPLERPKFMQDREK